MIVTRKWLEEFIDLDGLSTEEICEGLNSIGQEVEGVQNIRVADKVVVGYVKECTKHPDADKLNICKVDVGDEVVQIVCGAKNVRAGEYVAVSVVGAVLPGNFKIKKAKLRGVESFGMICSSTEIGLPKMEDGIMVLDNSIGDLKLGENVSTYLDDDIIELGITANRGDCFSIVGIARELSAKFNRTLKKIENFKDDKNAEGLGRILDIEDEIENTSHYLKAFRMEEVKIPFKIKYRLALVGEQASNNVYDFAVYATIATGVIVTIYDNHLKFFFKTDNKIDEVVADGELLYQTGLKLLQKPKHLNGDFVVDANFADPKYISTVAYEQKIKTDEVFFRASRGSNPDLEFGISYLLNEVVKVGAKIYNGNYELTQNIEQKIISVNLEDVYKIIGQQIEKNQIVNILNKLQIRTSLDKGDTIKVCIPDFRHDLENKYDIAEEILRVYGIDQLKSKPLVFAEKIISSQSVKYIKIIRQIKQRAVASGFFETIDFVFDDSKMLKKYGFTMMDKELDILNPIVSELDTLRQTLILQMLRSATNNKNNGYKKISLFSVGSVYNELREEYQKIGFVWSGASEKECVSNPKPKNISFPEFAKKIGMVFGEFELVEDKHILLGHPYQSAKVLIDGVEVGYIAKLHPKIAKDFDLDDTFIAEFYLDLLPQKSYLAKDIVKIQKSNRDLSLVVDKNISYYDIKNKILETKNKDIVEFYPIDIFDLGDKNSLTIRFVLQNNEKSLTDEEINGIITQVIEKLKDLGVELR